MGLVFLSLDRLSYTGYSDVQKACLSSSLCHWPKVTQPKLLREMESAPSVAALCLPLLLCLSLFTSVQAATGTHALHEAAAKEQSLIANWPRRVACTIPWNIVYRLPIEYELLLQRPCIAFQHHNVQFADCWRTLGYNVAKKEREVWQKQSMLANGAQLLTPEGLLIECHSIPPVVEYNKKASKARRKYLILVWWCKHKYTLMPALFTRLLPCSLASCFGIIQFDW